MSGTLSETALMLVGVMPSQKDFEIARLLGWYRIPMRMAPKIVDVDFLAFYQTSAFGNAHKWQIETFAEVKGHELTTRRELLRDEPDHPHANEEYYKIEIGTLQRRAKPILAGKWKRITFFYTTGQLFNQAETINDLVVRSAEREVLWQSLRERMLISQQYGQPSGSTQEPQIDPLILAYLEAFHDDNSSEEEFLEI
jgi:hypothetical protein